MDGEALMLANRQRTSAMSSQGKTSRFARSDTGSESAGSSRVTEVGSTVQGIARPKVDVNAALEKHRHIRYHQWHNVQPTDSHLRPHRPVLPECACSASCFDHVYNFCKQKGRIMVLDAYRWVQLGSIHEDDLESSTRMQPSGYSFSF